MITVILLSSALICYIVLLVTYKPQAKYKNGMLFAVTLPEQVMNHVEVGKIQARFNKGLHMSANGRLCLSFHLCCCMLGRHIK
jgi:hypothetical protein